LSSPLLDWPSINTGAVRDVIANRTWLLQPIPARLPSLHLAQSSGTRLLFGVYFAPSAARDTTVSCFNKKSCIVSGYID
jgi:hypothetical protein